MAMLKIVSTHSRQDLLYIEFSSYLQRVYGTSQVALRYKAAMVFAAGPIDGASMSFSYCLGSRGSAVAATVKSLVTITTTGLKERQRSAARPCKATCLSKRIPHIFYRKSKKRRSRPRILRCRLVELMIMRSGGKEKDDQGEPPWWTWASFTKRDKTWLREHTCMIVASPVGIAAKASKLALS
ncbi:hypothetical protein BDK51DRAFT_31749 [Blyttiomyces helicus]|uniref:Uncharacterized protein n=1 Tax=Blyttiomyces helicus TaxID=388810 RepID=A0A4P9WAU8_9FUNG|nr:hypothetical protein BDK51DRAFT_31749 [Blyttiomyces helicus]|eukprot:RKO89584.1 hypothetical protein BDK51DRAFT_31749 [Blyttiomyces helicus]